MSQTNERLFAALRALGCESRMTRDWFLAFTPTALRAISKVSNEFLAEVYEDPFAERSFVPAPLSRWRGAGDLGPFFRERTPVVVLGVDYGREPDLCALLEYGGTIGQRLRRAVISVPARHGMSHFASAAWPLWSAP